MQWIQKQFEDLTIQELYTILKERVDVFVVEQNCPYPEIDNYDQVSEHLYLLHKGEMVAYCRLLPHGTMYEEASIGRVLVNDKFRRQGYATDLMKKAVHVLTREWGETLVKLHAQSHLQHFYRQFGFKVTSDEYMDDGILHVDMLLNTKSEVGS
ncbi:GNAT family N-acetyltransferase [Salinibacillus xinjiangensis]|uniref:GNAT family N-acetyltransferase n=1 Tax=Salinibacillus xinjiangensis TaxID=1229268 RepID=A0A6G1X8K2_9BACI|nr:GNAT family N-acetyltransferase [Salinibacillus xinjiangensis]MRG87294.1 GNAT family N-acetyltransferase [Salinibacillus xinjiangensis]